MPLDWFAPRCWRSCWVPTGVGLVSLYRGLMDTASSIATMGVSTVGTRQIAEANAKEDALTLAIARRALFWATLVLGSLGALIVWILRRPLAQRVLGSTAHANVVGWLAIGVALTVVAASQGALIQGMRRIGDLARATVFGAVLNTVVGIAVIWKWGESALVFFVLLTPIASFLLSWWYASRLPRAGKFTISVPEMTHQWKMLLTIGVAFMGGNVAYLSFSFGSASMSATCSAPCPWAIPGIVDRFTAVH